MLVYQRVQVVLFQDFSDGFLELSVPISSVASDTIFQDEAREQAGGTDGHCSSVLFW